MFLVTALYGDGTVTSHLAANAVNALKWQAALAGDAWQVFINPLAMPLEVSLI
ncbi:hypothetical protein [Parvularcula sp. IMCC14364]|uniref:hypothetical protein n=1 Tax=Parvularcula sp. IMCC14364 TaxID=3067902 RepID=UPI0027423FDF|nr:hypothetical protein [Parvularcula sp. IMCC14364]